MKKLNIIIFLIIVFISGCGNKDTEVPEETTPQNTKNYNLTNIPQANKFVAENIIFYDYTINEDTDVTTIRVKNNSKYYLNNINFGIRKKDNYESLGYFANEISLRPNTSTLSLFFYESYEPFDSSQAEIYISDPQGEIFDSGEQGIKALISDTEKTNIIYATDVDIKFKSARREIITVSIKNNTNKNISLYGTKILIYSPNDGLFYKYSDVDEILITANQSEKYIGHIYSNHLTRNSVAIFTGADMSFKDWM